MNEEVLTTGDNGAVQTRLGSVVADLSADKQAFHVPWGKAMMWIFLVSDTFIFSCFLIGYMTIFTWKYIHWNP